MDRASSQYQGRGTCLRNGATGRLRRFEHQRLSGQRGEAGQCDGDQVSPDRRTTHILQCQGISAGSTLSSISATPSGLMKGRKMRQYSLGCSTVDECSSTEDVKFADMSAFDTGNSGLLLRRGARIFGFAGRCLLFGVVDGRLYLQLHRIFRVRIRAASHNSRCSACLAFAS